MVIMVMMTTMMMVTMTTTTTTMMMMMLVVMMMMMILELLANTFRSYKRDIALCARHPYTWKNRILILFFAS
jgi:hypothetical protein